MNPDYAKLPVQARVDIRELAGIAVYLREKGSKPRSRSDLLAQVVTIFHRALLDGQDVEPIFEVSTAKRVLDQMGLGFAENTPGHDRIVKALQEESRLAMAAQETLDQEGIRAAMLEELKNRGGSDGS